MAEQAGVNPQTLRYYERRGLLPVPPRTAAGYRTYDEDAVRIVRFVKGAQELGFSLTEIESLLYLAGGGPESCAAAQRLTSTKIATLDAKIAALTAMRASLDHLLATCTRPKPARGCPLLDSLTTAAEQ